MDASFVIAYALATCIWLPYVIAGIVYTIRYSRGKRMASESRPDWFVPPIGGSGGSDVQRKAIPREIREEIDQTPEWWDREFQRLSHRTANRTVHEVEYVTEVTMMNGARIMHPTRELASYDGCDCAECERHRRFYSEPPGRPDVSAVMKGAY